MILAEIEDYCVSNVTQTVADGSNQFMIGRGVGIGCVDRVMRPTRHVPHEPRATPHEPRATAQLLGCAWLGHFGIMFGNETDSHRHSRLSVHETGWLHLR